MGKTEGKKCDLCEPGFRLGKVIGKIDSNWHNGIVRDRNGVTSVDFLMCLSCSGAIVLKVGTVLLTRRVHGRND